MDNRLQRLTKIVSSMLLVFALAIPVTRSAFCQNTADSVRVAFANGTTPGGVFVNVPLDTVELNTPGATIGGDTVTIWQDGLFTIEGSVQLQEIGGLDTIVFARVMVNGIIRSVHIAELSASGVADIDFTMDALLKAGDSVGLQLGSNTAGLFNWFGSFNQGFLNVMSFNEIARQNSADSVRVAFANGTTPGGVFVNVPLDTVELNTPGASIGGDSVNIWQDGLFTIEGSVQLQEIGGFDTIVTARVLVNGIIQSVHIVELSASGVAAIHFTTDALLKAGDSVGLQLGSNTAGLFNWFGSPNQGFLNVTSFNEVSNQNTADSVRVAFANGTTPGGVFVNVPLDTVELNTPGAAIGGDSVNIWQDGLFTIEGSIQLQEIGGLDTVVFARVLVNDIIRSVHIVELSASGVADIEFTMDALLKAGDSVGLQLGSNTTGLFNWFGSSNQSFLNVMSFNEIGLPILLGDVNLDGEVNLLDVSLLVSRILTGTFQAEADCNQDGVVDLLDVAPFIDILLGN